VFRSHLQPSWRPRLQYLSILCIVLLAVKMVADVTETRNVIPSLEFKTWTTKKSKYWSQKTTDFWPLMHFLSLVFRISRCSWSNYHLVRKWQYVFCHYNSQDNSMCNFGVAITQAWKQFYDTIFAIILPLVLIKIANKQKHHRRRVP